MLLAPDMSSEMVPGMLDVSPIIQSQAAAPHAARNALVSGIHLSVEVQVESKLPIALDHVHL